MGRCKETLFFQDWLILEAITYIRPQVYAYAYFTFNACVFLI